MSRSIDAGRAQRAQGGFARDRVAGHRIDDAQDLVGIGEIPARVAVGVVDPQHGRRANHLSDAEQEVETSLVSEPALLESSPTSCINASGKGVPPTGSMSS